MKVDAMAPIVLASASPRRAEILTAAGIAFTVQAGPVDERPLQGESPAAYVRRLAKAKAYAAQASPESIVLGADTVVVSRDGDGSPVLLEKPVDAEDARRMLGMLSGRSHEVVTGICLLGRGGEEVVDSETTVVHFLPLTEEQIDDYVGSGEPVDKAGAYAIQGRACRFIHRVEGCYFNVVGLPISLVWRRLSEMESGD